MTGAWVALGSGYVLDVGVRSVGLSFADTAKDRLVSGVRDELDDPWVIIQGVVQLRYEF